MNFISWNSTFLSANADGWLIEKEYKFSSSSHASFECINSNEPLTMCFIFIWYLDGDRLSFKNVSGSSERSIEIWNAFSMHSFINSLQHFRISILFLFI